MRARVAAVAATRSFRPEASRSAERTDSSRTNITPGGNKKGPARGLFLDRRKRSLHFLGSGAGCRRRRRRGGRRRRRRHGSGGLGGRHGRAGRAGVGRGSCRGGGCGPGLLNNRWLLFRCGSGGLLFLLATGDERRPEHGNQAQGHELLHIPHLLFLSWLPNSRKIIPSGEKRGRIISQQPGLSTASTGGLSAAILRGGVGAWASSDGGNKPCSRGWATVSRASSRSFAV